MPKSSPHPFKVLVTANDTGVGKTWVCAQLVKDFRTSGYSVRYTKPVETGCEDGQPEDAAFVESQNPGVNCTTGLRFRQPLAPLAAAAEDGRSIGLEDVVSVMESDDTAQVHVIEGAGGISVPLDEDGSDWRTFAQDAEVDAVVVVVEDRLGAINQTRLVMHYLESLECPVFVWLNRINPDADHQNQDALEQLEIPLIAKAEEILKSPNSARPRLRSTDSLEDRKNKGLLRELKVQDANSINLASNDYLGLAQHLDLIRVAQLAAETYGTSSSASPLITGYLPIHQDLERRVCKWHGFAHGLIWNSGFQANRSLLSLLPGKDDILLADRLIHRSLVAGCLQTGATFQRYRHLDLDHLETLLKKASQDLPKGARIWVITESLFSMDGDFPDFEKLSELKDRYHFLAVVDEAHALGWYGEKGSGLLEHEGFQDFADILVGTFGKALASQGAYTLFRNPEHRETLVNFSEDFIYSTYLSPISAAVALKAVDLAEGMAGERPLWQQASEAFRRQLQTVFPKVPNGTSPILPLQPETPEEAKAIHHKLLSENIQTAFIRPPTVPPGSTRLRISLNASLDLPALATNILNVAKPDISVPSEATTWLGGWGIPPKWALDALAQYGHGPHHWLPPTASNVQSGSFDTAYSLGASLLLRHGLASGTELLAPFFDFKKESSQGGKIARAQLLYIRKWLSRDPLAALNDFYQKAGLPIQVSEIPYPIEDLLWGIEQLLEDVDLPTVPVSATAIWGEKDALLQPSQIQQHFSHSSILPSATHNLHELLP